MIQIEQRGKNLVKLEDFKLCTYSYNIPYLSDWVINTYSGGQQINVQNNTLTFMDERPDLITSYIALNVHAGKSYTISLQNLTSNAIYIRYGLYPTIDAANSIANAIEHFYVVINSSYTITPQHNGIALIGIGLNYVSSPLLLQFKNFQLEEGSVVTPYEDPWVNTLTFDDNLHAGEFLQKSKGIFYIHKTWYRDEQNNPYEQLTFTNGVATPSAITSEPVIVEDINTGEIKNAMVSGSAVNVYLNQYDSWDVTNSTTSAFTLSKTALKPDFPVAINGTVTTSGFTLTNTQITFDNPVASGSSVSCVYPYLDTSYNSDAKVFYQTTPKDDVISPIEAVTYKVVDTKADLPTSPEVGDTYLVQEMTMFYYWNGFAWKTIGGSVIQDTLANRPAPSQAGVLFVATDTKEIYLDTGSTWVRVGGDGTSTNTADTIVRRDASGNFSAGTITASLNGNASSATNADTVDGEHASAFTHAKAGGANIWVQSTTPTAISVGDLWIDTSG